MCCVWLIVMNLQRIISDSAAPLGFTELYSEFQLIVYLSVCNFTVLFHSQRSHSVVLGHSQRLYIKMDVMTAPQK